MEFVEGETLEHLIRRSGWIEVKLALEITDAGHRRVGCGAHTESRSPGHQTEQHHGASEETAL